MGEIKDQGTKRNGLVILAVNMQGFARPGAEIIYFHSSVVFRYQGVRFYGISQEFLLTGLGTGSIH